MDIRSFRCIVVAISAVLAIAMPLSAQEQPDDAGQPYAARYTSFDVAGARSTVGASINAAGVITGYYEDAARTTHGFVRSKEGTITTFDAPGAGEGAYLGTWPTGINAEGAITGYYFDINQVGHSFLRARDGSIISFDAPGAGTSPVEGTK